MSVIGDRLLRSGNDRVKITTLFSASRSTTRALKGASREPLSAAKYPTIDIPVYAMAIKSYEIRFGIDHRVSHKNF